MTERSVTMVVHEILLGDVEDPVLFAAEPLIAWEKTEQGQWVMKNSVDKPTWYLCAHERYTQKIQITATLSESNATYFKLKWR